ncbi:hypothetical protein [Ruminococcus sp.]|uniref:hypothetical protein n=1 Tax=Ruminococcus sp. TaxID=41978 RepID=UPI0025D7E41A|nr:hypothetical protein [Ruminococcus sp.]MBR1432203.1 hypothetical protein [Ruminococcus sp.]
MQKITKSLSFVIVTVITLIIVLPCISFSQTVKAENKQINIQGKFYEFDEDSEYELTKFDSIAQMDHKTIGSVDVSGAINKTYTKSGVTAFEVADNEVLSLKFSYDDTLKYAVEEEWHLYKDSVKKVDTKGLNDKVAYGAILLQTSFDGKRWYTNYSKTDISGDISFDDSAYINDLQLINGCYYRVILAYKLQIKVDPTRLKLFGWNFANIPDNEYKKNAEVYEFYAGYKEAENNIDTDVETFSIGEKQAVVADNGYYKNISLDSDDPHLGWDIGSFTIGGFTSHTKNNNGEDVFLKNVGDKVRLWFNMTEGININKLNNDSKQYINNDTNGYDQTLNVPMQNFKHGALIIRFTDYKGQKHDPIIYTNFLEAMASPGADTKVQLFEEGDYEVSLDYEIINTNWKDRLYNYKIAFHFQIRNSNTIVYPKDLFTGTYLANDSVTENGFVLDWAKSRYLDVNVKLSQWTKGANGYTEDIRYNRSAKESDVYDDTGIYTITVTNPTTDPYGNNPTIKKIYVGSDNVLVASMNAKNAAYSINDISNLVENEGYKISNNGELIPPADVTTLETTTITTTSEAVTTTTSSETTITITTSNATITAKTGNDAASEKKHKAPTIIAICSVAIISFFIIRKKTKKSKQ